MQHPQVSVIVPTYNYAHYLPRALDSLLGQQGIEPEIIVIDDGSTDETPEILKKYKLHIVAIRQSNAGVSAARNIGIAESHGDFIGFLDPDDFYHPDKLKRQVSLLERHPEWGWTYCDCVFLDETTGEKTLFSKQYRYNSRLALEGPRLFEALIPSNFICPLSLLIRRDSLDKAGHFDERFAGIEDFDLVLRLAATSSALYSPEILATYMWHPGSLGKNQARMTRDKYLILDKIVTLYSDRILNLGTAAKRALADMHNWFGYGLYREGRLEEAFQRLWTSLRIWPLQGRAWLFLCMSFLRLFMGK
jgi:glycosyltransferase involved in cell wall biosynthesis